MRTWKFLVVALLPSVVAGCRADPNIVLLERQLRLQEDEIYRLRGQLEDYQDVMQGPAMPSLIAPDSSPVPGRAPSDTPESSPSGVPPLPPSVLDMSGAVEEQGVPDTLKTPSEPLPADPTPLPSGPAPADEPRSDDLDEAPPFRQTSAVRSTSATSSGEVAAVTLSRLLCGGYDADGLPGDEGVTLLLQPRDAQGQLLDAPGEVAVVVLDPAQGGESARVGRWDFTAAQTTKRLRSIGGSRGMQLNALWPAAPPSHGKLHVFVRYTTADGKRFETDQPIEVALAGERSPRWVPTDPRVESPAPTVRLPHLRPARTATRPERPSIQRPTWSPDR